MLGRTAYDVYHSNGNGWTTGILKVGEKGWPETAKDYPVLGRLPKSGRLVESMSNDMLVGILTKEKSTPLAMVVDKRTSKFYGLVLPREVEVRFSPSVTSITVLSGKRPEVVQGNVVKLKLKAGEGQLLELTGPNFTVPEKQLIATIEPGSKDASTSRLRWTNKSSVPMKVTGKFEANDYLQAEPSLVNLTIPAHSSKYVDVKLNQTKSGNDAPYSLPMEWTSSYQTPDGKTMESGGVRSFTLEQTHSCARATKPVTIDGKLDEWDNLPFVCSKPAMLKAQASTWKGAQDCSFRFETSYDDQNIYLAIHVTDDNVSVDPKGDNWSQDGLEIRLDASPEPFRSACQGGSESAVYSALNLIPSDDPKTVLGYWCWMDVAKKNKLKMACVKSPGGYTAEIAMPLTYICELAHGDWKQFRLNIAVNDQDPGEGFVQVWWRPDWRNVALSYDGSGTFMRE